VRSKSRVVVRALMLAITLIHDFSFQQTKNRAMSLSKEAMENVQGRLKTVTESER
jgi:hypothetical protein